MKKVTCFLHTPGGFLVCATFLSDLFPDVFRDCPQSVLSKSPCPSDSVPQKELPPSIRDFISRHVRSVEQLEILLLFSKRPAVAYSVSKVYDAILSSPLSVQRWLDDLTHSGLLEKVTDPDSSYRCCSDATLISQIIELSEFYHTTPVRVIEAIYKREAHAAQSFADAFKIKTDARSPTS